MTELIGWSPNDEPISSQMNHSSSAGEEPMTNANGRHRTTTLSSQDNLKKKTKICSHVATWAPPPHGPTSGPSRTSTWQYTSTWTPPLRSHDHVAPTLQSHSFFLQTLLRCKKMCSLEDSNRRRDNNREVVLPLHHSTFCV